MRVGARHVVAALALAIGGGCSPGSTAAPPRTTATTLPVAPGPSSYHIVYRVEDLAGGTRIVSTDDLWVRRPFESRLDRRPGPPPGGAAGSTTVSSFGRYASFTATDTPLSVAVDPNVASGDLRLDATLTDLVRSGRLVPTARRLTVLGRPCAVYRTGEPLGTGDVRRPTAADHADECVDAHGLLLDEAWTSGGHLLRRRTAASVDIDLPVPDGLFDPPRVTPSTDVGGAAVTELAPGSLPPAQFWDLPDLPGFEHRGRYAVRATTDPAPGGAEPSTSITDVWVRGIDVVVISQGDQRLDPAPDASVARPVDAGRLPRARLFPGAYGNVVRAEPDAARVVRVTGTVPSDELLRIVRRLVVTS